MKACPCGSDHTGSADWPLIEELIFKVGETITITTPIGSWLVPRIFIAYHGLLSKDVPALADKYGWKQVKLARAV